jgi:hypothetical protein
MTDRAAANQKAVERLRAADPVLESVAPAREAVAGFADNLVLTSGVPMPWAEYVGGQRDAVIGTALFEGLAADRDDADGKLAGCVGSLAGVYSASMPVFAVRNQTAGNLGFCNMYEGKSPKRLNYGVYDDEVRGRLLFVQDVIAPVIAEAVKRAGGVALKPIMKRALHMGDEMHSRNTAASLLFARALFPHFLDLPAEMRDAVRQTVEVLTEDDYFFLRLSMAAAKAMADAMHGIEGASVVTAMGFNCKGFAIRVSGLGDQWFTGPPPDVEAKLFEGHSESEITWMGGESPITETVGLGGFAQAAAFALQAYQGGTPEAMVQRNMAMYDITVGEHNDFHIPYLGYRGTPAGIDLFKVLERGIMPVMDIGIAGEGGGQIGAGVVTAPRVCFEKAADAYRQRYGA